MVYGHGFWTTADDIERRALRAAGTVRTFPPGATILHTRDDDRRVAVLLAGVVRVVAVVAGTGPRTVIAVRHSGDIVGELSAIDGRPHSAAVEAVTAVRALVLTAGDLDGVTARHPRLLRLLLDVLAGRLRESDRRRVGYAVDLRTRLAGLLVENAERDGEPTRDGVVVHITSQADLANLIGTSRESLGRVLSALRAEGLVSTGRQRVVVHDVAALRAVGASGASGPGQRSDQRDGRRRRLHADAAAAAPTPTTDTSAAALAATDGAVGRSA